jgi:hypothetical protein
MTPQLRGLILAGSVISIAFGVIDLALGHVASGVFLAGLGSLTLISVLRRWRDESRGVKVVTSFRMIKAYSFVGVCALGGIALFVLAVMGAVREPILLGTLGLIATGGSIYVLVRSAWHRSR